MKTVLLVLYCSIHGMNEDAIEFAKRYGAIRYSTYSPIELGVPYIDHTVENYVTWLPKIFAKPNSMTNMVRLVEGGTVVCVFGMPYDVVSGRVRVGKTSLEVVGGDVLHNGVKVNTHA